MNFWLPFGVTCRWHARFFPAQVDCGLQIARKPDDQAQPVLGEAQRQLVQRELRLFLDLLELYEDLFLAVHRALFLP
jgi:hypothetical protein